MEKQNSRTITDRRVSTHRTMTNAIPSELRGRFLWLSRFVFIVIRLLFELKTHPVGARSPRPPLLHLYRRSPGLFYSSQAISIIAIYFVEVFVEVGGFNGTFRKTLLLSS
jgi:hypothetical protein